MVCLAHLLIFVDTLRCTRDVKRCAVASAVHSSSANLLQPIRARKRSNVTDMVNVATYTRG